MNVTNGICTKCFSRYYLNQQNQCVNVNPLCKTYNNNGLCLSCYPGYTLQTGNCFISGQGVTGLSNCK